MGAGSMLYQPPRPYPICTSHGQTSSAGASIVIPRVSLDVAAGTRSSPGSVLAASSGATPPVARQRRMPTYEAQPIPAMLAPTMIRFNMAYLLTTYGLARERERRGP